MKNLRVGLVLIIAFLFLATIVVYSASERNYSEMSSCRYLYSESNSEGSYIYGYNINTIYSANVYPNNKILSRQMDYKIRSVCHDRENSYALCERSMYNFTVLKLSHSTGRCDYYDFNSMKTLKKKSFAVSGNNVYFMNKGVVYYYIESYTLDGNKLNEYRFDNEIVTLFSNDSNVYVLLYNGDVYKLNNNSPQYCVRINSESKISNAGSGWIFCDDGELVSLKGKGSYSLPNYTQSAVVSGNDIYYSIGNTVYHKCETEDEKFSVNSNIKMLLAYDGKVIALGEDYISTTLDESDFAENATQVNNKPSYDSYKINSKNIMYGIETGTTVYGFKADTGATAVYDCNNNLITSGKIKSGYSATINGDYRYLSVRGDITGEGNVNSRDVSELMSYFIDKSTLDRIQITSSDYNYDGVVDNKDLVLISRKYESTKQ